MELGGLAIGRSSSDEAEARRPINASRPTLRRRLLRPPSGETDPQSPRSAPPNSGTSRRPQRCGSDLVQERVIACGCF